MKASLSQNINKYKNGTSNTGSVNYSAREIDSSAISVLDDVYSFSTDGNTVFLESIPQNKIEHFKVAIGTLTDCLEYPLKIKPRFVGHKVLHNLERVSLHLNTDAIAIKRNAISYARSKKVQAIKNSLKVKLSARDRIAIDRNNRLKQSRQKKLTKGIWLG